jgi:N-carbamoylputrescine amidase
MVMVVPGVYYNTAAVLDHDGTYLGKYRKTHIPHLEHGFWEKFYTSASRNSPKESA